MSNTFLLFLFTRSKSSVQTVILQYSESALHIFMAYTEMNTTFAALDPQLRHNLKPKDI